MQSRSNQSGRTNVGCDILFRCMCLRFGSALDIVHMSPVPSHAPVSGELVNPRVTPLRRDRHRDVLSAGCVGR
jgi:hypothetical protein